MAEGRLIEEIRGRPRVKKYKPTKKGIECPVCGGHTVERDIAPDWYYVEVCISGKLILVDDTGEMKDEWLSCPYWNTGWEER
jgi:hypothetical protein